MHSLKIKKVEIEYSQAEDKEYLDVETEVFNDGESIGIRKFGYPLDTSREDIEKSLKKVTALLDSEAEQAEKSAVQEKARENANEVKEELKDLEVKVEKSVSNNKE